MHGKSTSRHIAGKGGAAQLLDEAVNVNLPDESFNGSGFDELLRPVIFSVELKLYKIVYLSEQCLCFFSGIQLRDNCMVLLDRVLIFKTKDLITSQLKLLLALSRLLSKMPGCSVYRVFSFKLTEVESRCCQVEM